MNADTSRWLRSPWVAAILIALLFLLPALARLNSLHLFNPDSADYLLGSRSLAALGEYRTVDIRGEPHNALRPPGLSLVLLPATWIGSGATIPAKLSIVACSLLLLWLFYLLARGSSDRRWALLLLAVLASSPYTLLFGTEILSEAPFLLFLLGSLALLQHRLAAPSFPRLLLLAMALAFLVFLRTAGVGILLALGLWASLERKRWIWLLATLPAFGGLAWWAIRNARIGAPSYLGLLVHDLATTSLGGSLAKFVEGGLYYGDRLIALLLPATTRGDPVFWRVMVDNTFMLPGPNVAYVFLALAILTLSVAGMARRWRGMGSIALLVALSYLAIAAFWPFRNERMIWPITAIVLLFVPSGLSGLMESLARRGKSPHLLRTLSGSIAAASLLLVAWQITISMAMVGPNIRRWRGPDEFYSDRSAPLYYCDYEAPGDWLAAHSNPYDRILSRDASLALTSDRFQLSIPFETMPWVEIRRIIAEHSASFLAVPGRRFSHMFPWKEALSDRTYRLSPVYDDREVTLLRIEPNRTGSKGRDLPDTTDELGRLLAARKQHPHRVDLQRLVADRYLAMGDHEAAIEILEILIRRKVESGAIHAVLGWALAQGGDTEGALRHLERSRVLSGAGHLSEQVLSLLEKVGSAPTVSDSSPGQQDLETITGAIDSLLDGRGEDAESKLERLQSKPRYASVIQRIRKIAELEQALSPTGEPAELPAPPGAYLQLASLYSELGLQGKTLVILEKAVQSEATSPELLLARGHALMYFGLYDGAEKNFRAIEATAPSELDAHGATEALAAIATSQRVRRF